MFLFPYLRQNLFTAPYRLLPLAVFAFFVVSFLLHPFSPLTTGFLADPDDYMRLDEVVTWLQGQGWHDLSQPRMSPGAHTVIHWARLVDLPLAALMLPLKVFFSLRSAALIASFIVPPVLIGLLFLLVNVSTRVFVGEQKARLASLLALFAPMVLFNFTPGRVDHHGYQILVAGFGLFCLHNILQNKNAVISAVSAAVAFTCGLWIGTEALPWLILFIACLALVAAWQGGALLRHAAIFGGALAAAHLVILPIALPPSEFSSRALSWFSGADVIFAVLTAAVFIIGSLADRYLQNRTLRLTFITALGIIAAVLFAYLVPDILKGPFADYDDFNSTTALDNINEARPFAHAFWISLHVPLTWLRALIAFSHGLFLPLLALGAIAANLRSKNPTRLHWLVQGLFLMVAILMTLFWQVRVGYFMELFAIPPLVWLLGRGWQWANQHYKNRACFWAEIGVFLALGPLPIVLLPGLLTPGTLYRDVVLFPAARGEMTCPMKSTADFLMQKYGEQNLTIMSGMNEGPELLFRTPYSVVGGNYNVSGNPDVMNFFNARDDQTARDILRKRHVALVLTCRNIAPFLAGLDNIRLGRNAFLRPDANGRLRLTSSLSNPALVEKLVNGTPPDWLKPVEIPGDSSYLLYEFHE